MKKLFAVGPDFVLDTLLTFQNIENFKKFTKVYRGPFSKQVRFGYKTIVAGRGDEVVIDGKEREAKELVEQAVTFGADLRTGLGGNGAQEATALAALGCKVFFIGGYSAEQLLELPRRDLRLLKKVDLSFAGVSESYKSLSVILQAPETNRCILNDGRGRRIGQLAPYIQKFPDTLQEITNRYGELDALALVGLHGLFAAGINDQHYRVVKSVLDKARDRTSSMIFTDAGSLAAFTAGQRRLLIKIYSLFDILAFNGDELAQICRAIGVSAEDKFSLMLKLLRSSEKLSTIWLHEPHYQASMSTKFGVELLKKAQRFAAAAGVYRIEKGSYPTIGQLNSRVKSKDYSSRGKKMADYSVRKYGNKIGDMELAVTPCYRAKSFVSSIGAGDTASAAFIFMLAGSEQSKRSKSSGRTALTH
jgi:sugar/nucleoside kinase (ribokinase family)